MDRTLLLELERADAASADVERRTIAGTILPYRETGVAKVDGAPAEVRFLPGSLELARDRIPLVAGHDTDAPLGVMVELEDGDELAAARFSIDSTPAGDAALVQASTGSRSGLSLGALATEWREAADGVIEVTRAALYHVGLCAIQAFPGAQVSRVAAASAETEQGGRTMEGKTPEELAASIDAETSDEELAELLEHEDEAVRAAAQTEKDRRAAADDDGQQELEASRAGSAGTRERPTILARHGGARKRGERELLCSGGELVLAMVAAQGGDRKAARLVEAVLSEIESTDVPGLMPAAYVSDVIGGSLPAIRPLADRVAVKRPLPATGMQFAKPAWDTKPAGGWVAELAATPSNAPVIDSNDVTILEWAYGVAMSYAVATRSSPDAIEAIFREAVKDYYSDVEQKIADALMAVDQASAAGAGIGAGIAAFYGDELEGPNLLVVAPDIYGDLVDVIDTVPTYSSGAVSGATMTGTIAGLEVVVSPHLPAGTELITTRGVVELRESDPVRLTANVIGALKVELGVTAFAAFDTERPNAVHSLTPAAGAPAGTSEAKRTSSKSSSSKGSSK